MLIKDKLITTLLLSNPTKQKEASNILSNDDMSHNEKMRLVHLLNKFKPTRCPNTSGSQVLSHLAELITNNPEELDPQSVILFVMGTLDDASRSEKQILLTFIYNIGKYSNDSLMNNFCYACETN